MTANNQLASMLGTLLAQAENPSDMRLNTALGESAIAETIRIAMTELRSTPPPGKVLIDRIAVENALRE